MHKAMQMRPVVDAQVMKFVREGCASDGPWPVNVCGRQEGSVAPLAKDQAQSESSESEADSADVSVSAARARVVWESAEQPWRRCSCRRASTDHARADASSLAGPASSGPSAPPPASSAAPRSRSRSRSHARDRSPHPAASPWPAAAPPRCRLPPSPSRADPTEATRAPPGGWRTRAGRRCWWMS